MKLRSIKLRLPSAIEIPAIGTTANNITLIVICQSSYTVKVSVAKNSSCIGTKRFSEINSKIVACVTKLVSPSISKAT